MTATEHPARTMIQISALAGVLAELRRHAFLLRRKEDYVNVSAGNIFLSLNINSTWHSAY
jgi:hypothetical protein